RTLPFHGSDRGSNPRGDAKRKPEKSGILQRGPRKRSFLFWSFRSGLEAFHWLPPAAVLVYPLRGRKRNASVSGRSASHTGVAVADCLASRLRSAVSALLSWRR